MLDKWLVRLDTGTHTLVVLGWPCSQVMGDDDTRYHSCAPLRAGLDQISHFTSAPTDSRSPSPVVVVTVFVVLLLMMIMMIVIVIRLVVQHISIECVIARLRRVRFRLAVDSVVVTVADCCSGRGC